MGHFGHYLIVDEKFVDFGQFVGFGFPPSASTKFDAAVRLVALARAV